MKRPLLAFAALIALAAPLCQAQAHRQWMAPSMTVLSGDDPWVGIDIAVSNDLFYADHNPGRLDTLVVTQPDGTPGKIENGFTGKYRSVFDVHLTQPGTYRIASVSQGLSARYKLNGEDKGWRGSAADLKTAIPAGAAEVKVTQNQGRNETFVTRGKPTDGALKPTGVGLELIPVTHPNDLVAQEKATFKLLLDGRPAAGLKVTTLPGASRYRDSQGEIDAVTGADGTFSVTWPEAGMWWLNASVRGEPGADGVARNASYSGVFEVLKP